MIGDTRVELAGIIKGSGMIAPDMATMLGYVFTDADVAPAFLQEVLSAANARDLQLHHRRWRHLDQRHGAGLRHRQGRQCAGSRAGTALARMPLPPRSTMSAAILRSWSCAMVRVRRNSSPCVFRALPATTARAASGLSIANSPLVKTAIAGEDANWGRVVMAVGKAGEPADRDRLSIAFGGIWAARDGLPVEGL